MKNRPFLSGNNMHYKFIFWLKTFFFFSPGTSSKVRKAELVVSSKKMSVRGGLIREVIIVGLTKRGLLMIKR